MVALYMNGAIQNTWIVNTFLHNNSSKTKITNYLAVYFHQFKFMLSFYVNARKKLQSKQKEMNDKSSKSSFEKITHHHTCLHE